MPGTELTLGGFGLSVLLYVVLGLIWKVAGDKMGDRFKPLVAVVCGIVLGVLALVYAGIPWSGKSVIDFVFAGAMTGFAAVGMYENQRMAVKPRD